MITWGAWTPSPAKRSSPYVDWWWTKERSFDDILQSYYVPIDLGSATLRNGSFTQRAETEFSVLSELGPLHQIGPQKKTVETIIAELYGLGVPVPAHAKNDAWKPETDWDLDEVLPDMPLDIPEDTVIVGVVDTGIALGHRRFRLADGETRIISAWQQTSKFCGQPFLPCGREIYADKINSLLRKHSHDHNLKDGYDEDGFNREAGLVEPERLFGQRDLDQAIAHGTHVADLAAGFDPQTEDRELLKRVRIVAINLPSQVLHGSAGNYLHYYAALALDRIIFIANALWKKNFGDRHGGFRILLNFSYAMHAGPKDGTMPIERAMSEAVAIRPLVHKKPLSIFMPAGNFNQDQFNARLALTAGGAPVGVDWRLLPSDHSSNFFEIWSEPFSEADAFEADEFSIEITPPGLAAARLPAVPVTGHYSDLGDFARVYYDRVTVTDGATTLFMRHRFTVCAAPTYRLDPYYRPVGRPAMRRPIAPAGAWTIRMKCARDCTVDLYVQSDQSDQPQSAKGLASSFEDGAYRRILDDGRPRDSFPYPCMPGCADQESGGPVTRIGTVSALSTAEKISAWGSYRHSDGKPALYSSTSYDRRPGENSIAYSMPTDDGPGHFGILASGSRDGSIAAYRGTSMACALGLRRELANVFGLSPGEFPAHYESASPQKIGAARLPYPGDYDAHIAKRRMQRD